MGKLFNLIVYKFYKPEVENADHSKTVYLDILLDSNYEENLKNLNIKIIRKQTLKDLKEVNIIYAEIKHDIQQYEAEKIKEEIYDNIFLSMSNGGVLKPNLRIIDDTKFERVNQEVATYSPTNKEITIGLSFIELTRKFGKDSNNARVHVLSHELAHLFLNHGYVSVVGTGFASKEINKEFKKTKEFLDDKMGELEADQWAFFYSYIAGYKKANSIGNDFGFGKWFTKEFNNG